MEGNAELLTFGEAMVRLSPPRFERLEQAVSLDVRVGGSELNVAVTAARLGMRVGFISRLTRNPLGRMIENKAREHGVDTSHIAWTDGDRVGTYYAEFGASPRANSVIYDRRGSAMAHIQPDDIAWRKVLAEAAVFHTSGITPALSKEASRVTLEAIRAAKESGVLVSVDLNYRSRLWSQEDAAIVMSEVVREADVLITTEEDTARVFGITGPSYDDVARKLVEAYGVGIVAITLRENPSVWRNSWTAIAYDGRQETVYHGPRFEIEVVDRVGSGDAFAGGFLYGLLRDGAEAGLRYGVAVSAIKQTHPGDLCFATRDEAERILSDGGLRIIR